MLDFLLQLKSLCFILASACKKSLFLFFSQALRECFHVSSQTCPVLRESQFFPPGSRFSPHCILAAWSVLPEAGLSRAGGSFRQLTGDIFTCTHQCTSHICHICHICLFKNNVTLSIYIRFVIP